MKTLANTKFKNSLRFALLFIAIVTLIFVYGCDTFEEDALPPEESVEISSDQVYVLPNSSSVIDLAKVISAKQEVSVTITDQPDNGEFKNISGNLFRYQPKEDFLEGTDQVGFDVFDTNSQQLSQGVININITQDTSLFPCTIIAVEDQAETRINQPVFINVLGNDRLCGSDSLQVEVAVVSQPANGEADFFGNVLQYFPNQGFAGTDSLLYRVNPPNEPDSGSVAFVFIQVNAPLPCELDARDDSLNFIIPNDDFWTPQVDVNVLANDSLCNSDSLAIGFVTIVQPTRFGDVAVVENNIVRYWINTGIGNYRDSLVYEICKDQVCDRATVVFNIEEAISVLVQGVDDTYDLSDFPTSNTYRLNVLQNDIYTNLSNVNIEIAQQAKAGEVGVSDKQVVYSPFNPQAQTDSLVYRICEEIGDGIFCDSAVVRIKL